MAPSLRVALTLEQCWHRVPGGTAVAALGMARALAERDELEVLGVAALHRAPPAPPWAPPVQVHGLPLPRVALYEAWHRLRWPSVERATGTVDLVHATSIAVPPRSVPLLVTIHDLAFLKEPSHFTARGLRFFHRGLELARDHADLVLCSSEATMRDCLEAGFATPKLRHVPLGVDATPADPESVDRVRRSYGLGRPYVLWIGTIEPRKNLPRLLQAFAALDADVDLVLVGPKGWKEDLDALLGDARERIRVLGFVPLADLAALYAGASVFCLPSLLEGFGFPVLEAMAQGTPVVTSRGTSTEELAGGAGVLVDPLDSKDIARALARVLADPPRARALGDAGIARAAVFSWKRTADLVAGAYGELAGAVSRPQDHA
ncbi:MAG: glycosyltransferase family 4 protein [Actinomycetota bacterium]|nr:glycosyltransferase family 4 protein [Actinomycetota bacterium]